MNDGQPLAVLHVAANRWWTGSADPVIHAVRGLRARGHRAMLAVIPGGRFEEKAREAGIEPVTGLRLESRLDPAGVVRDAARLHRLVADEGIDVVHCHHSHDHWLASLCRRHAALVRTFHNGRAVHRSWPSTALYRRTDGVVAVSADIEARCLAAGVRPQAVFRSAGVVDTTRFDDGSGAAVVRKEFGIEPDAPLVGMVARLAANRGHEALIRAFARLLPREPAARLLLVGKGERRDAIEEFIRGMGLTGQVVLAGYRDADLPAVLAALDVFVLMGAGSDESCRAALEAMAAGRAVVARGVGALRETVVHGVTGLIVDDDRPESVTAALGPLLADRSRARAMGAAGRQRAREQFGTEPHAIAMEAIYRAVLAGRPRPGVATTARTRGAAPRSSSS